MKKNIKYSIVFLVIFFSGILFERFELDNKTINLFKNTFNGGYRIIYSLTNTEKIFVDIDNKHYEKILETRKKALKLGVLKEDMQKWGPAKLKLKDNSYDVEIRLKGAFPDHWSDLSKLSFKIKINNDSKPVHKLRRFNLQSPDTLSYLYEWLFFKALQQEKLINLKLRYYELILNGNSQGVYVLQEGISQDTLSRNKRTPGPIIGFSKNNYLEEIANSKKLQISGIVDSLNGLEDTFWRAKIEPVQLTEHQEIDEDQQVYLKKALYLLNSFRDGSLKPNQVFDIKKLAKVMAIRAILGSSEFDYRDTKFYFDPNTSLLEPISKEIHVNLDLDFKDHYYSWWIDSSKVRPHYTNNTNFFLDLLYGDYKFYKAYLSELNDLSNKKYINNLINLNKDEFNENFKILKKNYPTQEIFSKQQLEITRIRIQDLLNPIQNLNVNFLEYKKNILKLNISNLQRLPIEIIGLKLKDGTSLNLKEPLMIKGKKPLYPAKKIVANFDCEFREDCKKHLIEKQKLIFKILGQKKDNLTKISKY